jgi:uncharacterized membrane protein (UPF0127 family)
MKLAIRSRRQALLAEDAQQEEEEVDEVEAATSTGCAAYSIGAEAYEWVETPLRFRRLGRTELLGLEVPVATTRLSRLLGLALLPRGRAGAGLLIPRCRSVHTFGMRFRLDLLFLDGVGRVVELRRAVPPGRVVRCSRAMAVLELPSP